MHVSFNRRNQNKNTRCKTIQDVSIAPNEKDAEKRASKNKAVSISGQKIHSKVHTLIFGVH